MSVSLQRRAAFLVAVVLVGLLTTCTLPSLGVATQAVQLPLVLVDTSVV